MALSLYIHIPFCLKRCIYCDFVSGIYDPKKEGIYIASLKKEILNIPKEIPFSTLYIGGGTPTVLSNDVLSGLIDHVFNHFNFTENYEATIEANPETLDKDKLQAIRSFGINRISIGVQSFNDEELAFLGRIHSSEDARRAIYLAKDVGFKNIGIDLIYGLPGQSIERWRETLEKAVSLKLRHISAYELTAEKGTLLYKYLLKDNNLRQLDEEEIIEMYNLAIDCLTSNGFIHYEISNLAMPDHFCKHNLNYWNRGEYYGSGPGAHSFVGGKRFYNNDKLDEYIKALSENRSPVKGSKDITEENSISEAIFLELRKTEGINFESFARRYKKNFLTCYQKEIKLLKSAGLIEITGPNCSCETNIRLTKKGLLLSNEVFKKFII